jgi:hypothetical protein
VDRRARRRRHPEDEHARRDGDPRGEPTADDELRGRHLRQSRADEARDESADGREADARRSPAGVVGERLPVGGLDGSRPTPGVLAFEELPLALAGDRLLRRIVVDQEATERQQSHAEGEFQHCRRDDVCEERAADDGRDGTEQQPLRGGVVDDALSDVVQQTVSHPEHLRQ